MDERQALGQRLQIERPVERRIAAADDHQVLVAELLHLAHRIEDRCALIRLDARNRRTLRLERTAAGRDHHDLAEEGVAGVGGQAGSARPAAAGASRPSDQMEGRIERLDLLDEFVDQPLAGDHRKSGNVVDRLLGIKLGALAAGLVENVDQSRVEIEKTQFEDREKADRTSADDDDVLLDYVGSGGRIHRNIVHPQSLGPASSGRHLSVRIRQAKQVRSNACRDVEQLIARARRGRLSLAARAPSPSARRVRRAPGSGRTSREFGLTS